MNYEIGKMYKDTLGNVYKITSEYKTCCTFPCWEVALVQSSTIPSLSVFLYSKLGSRLDFKLKPAQEIFDLVEEVEVQV